MKILLSILILCCVSVVYADSTEVDASYFHPAASLYIHGDLPASSNLVVKGLAEFPDNGKLLRLKELIEKAQEQQQEQQDQDQNQQQNQDQQQNDQQNNQQEQQQDQEQQNQDQNQEQQQQEPHQQQSEPQSTEQMTPDEAQQLMDAMKQEEQNKRMQLHPVLGAPVKVDKDW